VIEQARRLPTPILVLGLGLIGGFVAVIVATIISVGTSPPESPDLEDLALPVSVQVVDSHATCDASACDGYGLVVDRDGMAVTEMATNIADRLRIDDWVDDAPCDEGAVCLQRDDLRVEIRPWLDVPESVAPAMRASLTESGVDQARLVYVAYYRCGVLRSCV
jgi:hypothetical protein